MNNNYTISNGTISDIMSYCNFAGKRYIKVSFFVTSIALPHRLR